MTGITGQAASETAPRADPALAAADAVNRIRWNGQANHHEVWYLTLNDPRTGAGFWLRYTLHSAKDGGLSATRLWFVSFILDGRGGECARWHDQPLLQPSPAPEEFALELAAGRLTSRRAMGQLTTPEGTVEWDLGWSSQAPPRPMLPAPLGRVAALLGWGLWVAAPAAQFSGTVRVGDRSFTLERAPGSQSHHWGEQPWHRWTWFSCSSFEDAPDAFLEGLAIQWPPRWPLPLGLCSAVLRWDGRVFEMSGLRSMLLGRAQGGADGLWLSLEHPALRLHGLIESSPDEMVQVGYHTLPTQIHGRYTAVGRGTLIIEERSRFDRRWHEAGRLHANRTFHWEAGSPEEDPRVRRMVLPAP